MKLFKNTEREDLCRIWIREVCAQSCNYQGCAGTAPPAAPPAAPPPAPPPAPAPTPAPNETDIECVDYNQEFSDLLALQGVPPMSCSEAVQEIGKDKLCVEFGYGEYCAQSCDYQGCASSQSGSSSSRSSNNSDDETVESNFGTLKLDFQQMKI